MPRRSRERFEFILWIFLSLGSALIISDAHDELVTALNAIKGCPYASQR